MVQPADDVQLGGPAGAGLPGALDDLVAVHHISPVFAQVGPERTKVAGVDAHVRRVDVRVHVVIREIAVVSLAHQVGHRAQGKQVVRSLERQPIFEAQPLAGLDFFANRIQGSSVSSSLGIATVPVLAAPGSAERGFPACIASCRNSRRTRPTESFQ